MELRGKTLGLVGTGDIAMRAAAMFKAAFSMRVIGFSPSLTDERAKSLCIGRCASVAQVFANADIISVGVRLSDETRGLIGEKELSAAKPGALLINTARGGVVNEQALYRALVHGPLGGAACDVFASEPPTRENPLVGLPNFIATPHIGASTDEALLRVGLSAVTQIFDVLDGKTPVHECF
jgi:D-3-phosphoglycerate dehydrogenase